MPGQPLGDDMSLGNASGFWKAVALLLGVLLAFFLFLVFFPHMMPA